MKTIKITGIGRVSATPNQIEVKFSLNTGNPNYNKALDLHSEKLDTLVNSLTELNFEKKDIKTTSFTIRPKYNSVKTITGEYKDKFDSFQVNQSLIIRFDLNMKLLDKIINSLARNNIDPKIGISFTVKEKEEIENQLLEDACKDARKKAEILATCCGQKIIGLSSIDYSFSTINFFSPTMYENRFEESSHEYKAKSSIGDNLVAEDIKNSLNATFVFEVE